MTKKNKETFGNPDNRDQNVNESFANNISIVKNPNYKPGEEFDSFGATKTAKEFLAELGNRVTIDDPTDSIIFSNTISFANGAKISLPANVGIIANGTLGSAGQVLTTNGSAAYWATSNGGGGGNGSVNTAASYTWTNNHTFTTNTNGNVYIGLLTNSVNPQLKGSGIVVANGGLYLAGKTAASNSEGGEISLGYANKVFDTNSMSLSNTWSIDVFGYKDNTASTPNSFRIFNYDSVGTTHSAIEIIPQEGGGSVVPNKIVLGSNKFITSNTTIPFAVNFCGPIGPLTANESIDFGSVTNKWGNAYFSNVILSTKGANISSQLVMVAGSGSVLNMGSDGLDGRPAPNNAGVFVAQNDRTFAFYSTLTTGAGRPIWAIRTEADPTVPPDTEATGNPGDKLGTGFFLEAPLVLRNGIVPYGSGSKGSNGQVLISTGNTFPGVKWQDISAVTVNTTARYTWTNTHTFTNVVTFSSGINAGGNTGANGQVLTSNGTAVLWTNAGSGSVNTAAQYIWTNTHTFTNLITISTNGGTSNGYMKWGEDNTSFVTLNLQPSDNNFVFYRSTAGGNSTGEPVMAWFYNPDPANTFQKSVTFTQDIMLFGGIYDNYGGSKGTAGQILSATGNSPGQGVKWINAVAGSVNTAAQYTWTNTHIFSYSGSAFSNVVTIQNSVGAAALKFNSSQSGTPRESTIGMQTDGKFIINSTLNNGTVYPVLGWWSNANSTLAPDIESDVPGQAGNGLFVQVPLVLRNGIVPYNTNSRGTAGQVLTATGEAYPAAGLKWADVPGGGGSVNTAAQYTWTNTHTFNSTATFNGTISATKYNLAGGGSIGNNGTGISVPGNIQADGSATSISVATAGGVQAGFYAGGAGKTCGFYIGTDNATHMACGTTATTLDTAGNFFIPGYLSPPKGIYATNGLGSSGQVLTSTGSGVQWSTAGGGGTAPGNKGPITVTTDASWSLNAGVVQNTNLAGGITPDKLATTGGYGFAVEGGTMTKIFAGGGAATMFGNNDFYFPSAMVYKPGGGVFESGSDLRTKKNIVTYSDGLEAILSLKPINYQFNGLVEYSPDDGKTHVGLIAQDVLETPMSYMISTHINKTKGKEGKYDGPELETYSIGTASIPFALINAVKELNSLVTNLTEENKKLRADMDSLLNKTQTKKK